MAKQCCVCGNPIKMLDGYETLQLSGERICLKCCGIIIDYVDQLWQMDSPDSDSLEELKKKAEAAINAAGNLQDPDKLKALFNEKCNSRIGMLPTPRAEEGNATDSDNDPNASLRKELDTSERDRVEAEYDRLCDEMILSTAGSLEGYRITKQLGVVFGETVFKPSAGQQLVSGIGDMFRAFSFSQKEMKGQVEIIEQARRFAYLKMMKAAQSRGANAIIAIDSDNTIGENICYLSLFGTAVVAEKN